MTRISQERHIVDIMVRLYCRRKEGNKELCPQCAELLEYAHRRLDKCVYGEKKPTCRTCPIHCYKPEMKQRMKAIMKWTGPRMMLYHPKAALMHLTRELWGKMPFS